MQHEIIWYHRPTSSMSRMNSTSSITDSMGSSHSMTWKISSQSFESVQRISITDSPLKSPTAANPLHENSFDSEIQSFLKVIFDKLSMSLATHEATLVNKVELAKARHSISEASSDTGSVLSLDDGDFNLSDPVDQESKRFQDENRFAKGNRSRQYLGRFYKQTADQSMLCGNYFESFHYYQLAICYLKKVNDQLWLAGAEEGLCCSWIVYNFPALSQSLDGQQNDSLLDRSRQLISNLSKTEQTFSSTFLNINTSPNPPDQADFSFLKKFTANDIFKNPPEIHNLAELDDKYHSCISRYKKTLKNKLPNLHPIHLESIIKASRFFIDQHRFLEASNFLKMIKTDLSHIQNDLEQYHNTLAQLYYQMGFFRKSALHKYQMLMIIQSRLTSGKTGNKQQINEQKMNVLVDILNDLSVHTGDLFNEKGSDGWVCVLTDESHGGGAGVGRVNAGCQTIKSQIVTELFHLAKCLDYPVNTVLGLGLSLLDNWHGLFPLRDCERLVADLNSISKSTNTSKDNNSTNRNASVMNLPRLTKVMLTKLPEYLLPKQPQNVNDKFSVFLYTPLKSVNSHHSRTAPLEPVIWICGEECEIVLQFDNATRIPLQLHAVSFLLNNVETNEQIWVPSEGSSIHYLQMNDTNIHCHFVVVPNLQTISTGNYRIVNVSYQLTTIGNITFLPHRSVSDAVFQSTAISEIKLYYMMPQLRMISSISEQFTLPLFQQCRLPPSVVCCASLLLFDNEVFEFSLFLSNESKDIDVDQIVCTTDEFNYNPVSKALISRFADQEYSNRKGSSHRLLSFSQANLEKCLPIKSIGCLKNYTNNSNRTNNNNPTLPTEAIVKFRIDSTDREWSGEFFRKACLNKTGGNLAAMWHGQLRITVQYWSNAAGNGGDVGEDLSNNSDNDDVVFVKKENSSLSTTSLASSSAVNAYRESLCVVNCQLMAGLGLIEYRVDDELNLALTLMNFTESKVGVMD